MTTPENKGGAVVVSQARVENLEGQVVGDGANEVLRNGVVLDIVDYSVVVLEGARRLNFLVFDSVEVP